MGLPGGRYHPHPVPKETSLREGQGEEEEAQEDSKGLGPSALGPHFCLPRTPCRQRALQCTWALAHWQGQGETDTDAGTETRGSLIFKKLQWSVRPGADGCPCKPSSLPPC